MQTEKCNGWTNYETWLFRIWLDEARLFDARLWGSSDPCNLAQILREWAGEERDRMTGTAGMMHDLLTAAFHRIDWEEISEAMCYDLDCPSD